MHAPLATTARHLVRFSRSLLRPAVRRPAGVQAAASVHSAAVSCSYPPIKDGLVGAVGSTPLVRLNGVSEETGCEILAKAEFMNPGGSVKDRAALGMVLAAEKSGELAAGGTVVEGTAGNTGIGLAHVCNAKGYRCVIYMPDTQSQEKIDLLRALGAEVRPVPAVPVTDPANYNWQARDFADETTNAVWTNQFDNTVNRDYHVETTGPEIWAQTDGKVSAFTCATGTGGTLAGVAKYLKSQSSDVRIVLADPPGSVLHAWFQSGGTVLEREGSSITEGIGQGRVTDNLAGAPLDGSLNVPDEVSVEMVYRMLHEEGLFMGASSGLNVAAAVQVAKDLGPGHTVVTMICDSGSRYQSRLFNPSWLEERGLLACIPEKYRPVAL